MLGTGLFSDTLPKFIMSTDWEALKAPEREGPGMLPEAETPQGIHKNGSAFRSVDGDTVPPAVPSLLGTRDTQPAAETAKARLRLSSRGNLLGHPWKFFAVEPLGGHFKKQAGKALPQLYAHSRRAEMPKASEKPYSLHTLEAKLPVEGIHAHPHVLPESTSEHGLRKREGSLQQGPTALRPWGYPATIPFPVCTHLP